MLKEITLLLKETKDLLDNYTEEKKDNLHSKITAIYLYLQEYTGETRDALVKEYNLLVEKGKELGISKIKRIHAPKESITSGKRVSAESENIKKREDQATDPNKEKMAASILDHSKILKKKAESFGQMVENSKNFVDKVSTGMKENVKQVQKGVSSLEHTEWYSLSTGQAIFLLLSALFIFIIMYGLIRVM